MSDYVRTRFRITKTLHGLKCVGCIQAADEAEVLALCTGSVGASSETQRVLANGFTYIEHAATVKRINDDTDVDA